MDEKEVKKCLKCGGEMVIGQLHAYGGISIGEEEGRYGGYRRINSYYCKSCGFIELYREQEKKQETETDSLTNKSG